MNESGMTLATDWDYRDCMFYFWSEKFDGCRAYWDGERFWTRGGNVIQAPDSFVSQMPYGVHLDGEIWCGRGRYIESMNAVRHGLFTDSCRFVCFDAPKQSGDWLKRMKFADTFTNETLATPERGEIKYRDEPSEIADRIIKAGGEGLILRHWSVKTYEAKRTRNLMRIKARNLFAPWHGLKDPRPPIDPNAPPVYGFDLRQIPFDPEIEWKIRSALGTHSHAAN